MPTVRLSPIPPRSRRPRRRRLRATPAVLLAALLQWLLAHPAGAVDVRLHDPVYEFLERAEVFGWLDDPLHGARPYDRLTVAAHLAAIQDHRSEMAAIDRTRLDRFRFLFADELRWLGEDPASEFNSHLKRWMDDGSSPNGDDATHGRGDTPHGTGDTSPAWLFPDGRDLVELHGPGGPRDWRVEINPYLRLEHYQRLPEDVTADKLRSTVWATGGSLRFRQGRISAYGAAADNHASVEDDQIDSTRYPYYYYGQPGQPVTSVDFYDTEAEIAWHGDHVQLYLGKHRQRWGGGETGSLILNDSALPYTHFRLRGRWGPLGYTMAQARLQTEPRIVERRYDPPDLPAREIFAEKWFAAQWFELHPWRTVRIAFFEQVIYGERGWDVEYLNPLMFLQAAEHFTGDPDNMLLGLDLRWIVLNRARITAQVVFDELTVSKFGSNDNSNKFGVLAGLSVQDPLGVNGAMAYVEYARLRPYLYTHKYPINRATHLGRPLGYPTPPNSDNLEIGWRQDLSATLQLAVRAGVFRHGRNPDGLVFGGSIRDSDFLDGARTVNETLDGDRLTETRAGLTLRWEPLWPLRVDAGLTWVDRELTPWQGQGAGAAGTHLLWQVMLRYHPAF